MITKSEHRSFGGTQGFYEHESRVCAGPMKFGVYLPPNVSAPVPALYFLAGLECNEQTFAMKAGAQSLAAELGLAIVTPDTSPRAARFPGDDASWDFGIAASFYVDATVAPYSGAYQMRSYVVDELPGLVEAKFPIRKDRRGIFGHSMGGHGALTIALSHPERYASVSAIAPICAPADVPWGQKAFKGYLGLGEWAAYDATALVTSGKRCAPLRIDQGTADKFLETQLRPEHFERACAQAGQPLELVMHAGYDHGYYFISSVMEAQLRHHASALL